MFVEEGVYDMGQDFQKALYKSVVWTLVGSDGSRDGVPDILVHRNTSLFVIYATSPVREWWSRLHRAVSETVVVMNPWTRREIHQA